MDLSINPGGTGRFHRKEDRRVVDRIVFHLEKGVVGTAGWFKADDDVCGQRNPACRIASDSRGKYFACRATSTSVFFSVSSGSPWFF